MHDDESYDIFDEHDVPRALQKWLVDAKLQDAVSVNSAHCLKAAHELWNVIDDLWRSTYVL